MRRGVLAAGLVVAALAATGCSTTQDEAARLQLNSARIRAAELPTVVRSSGTRVRVDDVTLLTAPGGSAVVVRVRNPGRRSVADLPISVGVRLAHRRSLDLNARSTAELSYFHSHLPAVAAGHSLTWVFATGRALGHAARPFAIVGGRPRPAPGRLPAGALPRITVRMVSRTSSRRGRSRLVILVRNTTTLPQYQLPVYAIARRGGRTVAGGTADIAHLGSHGSERVALSVVGRLAHAELELAAAPTIYH